MSRPVIKDRVVLGVGALAVVLVVVLALLIVSARGDELRTASNGQVTSASYRAAAMNAAEAHAATVFSYSYRTLAKDQADARALLTPDYAEEYDSVMADAREKATAAKLTQEATVLTSALLSITQSRAEVLLYLDTATTAEGSTRQQLLQNRVKMSLERKDDAWAVSNMVRF